VGFFHARREVVVDERQLNQQTAEDNREGAKDAKDAKETAKKKPDEQSALSGVWRSGHSILVSLFGVTH
jgi:hypothetical protein